MAQSGRRGSRGGAPSGRLAWYSRYAMWWEALKLCPSIAGVRDLSDADYITCLQNVNEYYRKNPRQRESHGVERCRGPEGVADRHSACAEYNGLAGGRMLK